MSPLDCKEIQQIHPKRNQSYVFIEGTDVEARNTTLFGMTNIENVLKSRDITLPIKVCLVKAMVFRVVMYGCESWTIKKAEHQRIDAPALWCLRRLLRVPWTARRSN